jgi:chemotaxis protein MotA
MEITNIAGYALAAFAILFGIVAGDGIDFARMANFFDVQSLFIVVVGCIACIIAATPFRILKKVPKHLKMIFIKNKRDPLEYIEIIVELSREARKKGLLALEDKANNFEDEFLKESILFIVDAIEPDKLKARFQQKLDYIAVRDAEEKKLYDLGAALGPSFGMLGTLVGLINMLKSMNLEGGAGQLGQDMSVALITTFYGSILANVIFTPLGNKLEDAQSQEMLFKEMIIEGVISIKEGENPKYIEEKLLNFLENSEKKDEDTSKKEE